MARRALEEVDEAGSTIADVLARNIGLRKSSSGRSTKRTRNRQPLRSRRLRRLGKESIVEKRVHFAEDENDQADPLLASRHTASRSPFRLN